MGCLLATYCEDQPAGPPGLAAGGQGIRDTYPAAAVPVEEQALGPARRSQPNLWRAAAPSNGETALPFRTGGKQIGTVLGQGLG